MVKLATIYANHVSGDFDVEIAAQSQKKIVTSWEEAVAWIEAEIKEGREAQPEWTRQEWTQPLQSLRMESWSTPSNEYGYEEVWILAVEDVS